MAGYKINRVTSDIRLCLSELLREVKDPRVSKMLSIVKLDVSGDMSDNSIENSAHISRIIESFDKSSDK